MPNYRRNRQPGGTYFFTVNLLDRKSQWLVTHIDELRTAVRKTRQMYPFHIDAWVVLPEHLHCIWTLPEGDTNYSNRWRLIKQGSKVGRISTAPSVTTLVAIYTLSITTYISTHYPASLRDIF